MPGRPRTTASLAARVLLVLISVAAPLPVLADGRVQFLAGRLKYPPAAGQPDDFRVRTNAALALGASNDDDAATPLCLALADPSELVRQAAALALKRLARASSAACLRRRLPVEGSPTVKQEIQHAIESAEASAGSGGAAASGMPSAAPYVANARFYVSISAIANNTTRPKTEIERIVHDAIASKLADLGAYQVAPAGESNDAARGVLAKRRLTGFYLAVSVDKFDYSEGSLRVRVKIAVFSYPGKDLRGEVPAGATLPGARPGDNGAEDQMLGLVASRAAELFAQNFK